MAKALDDFQKETKALGLVLKALNTLSPAAQTEILAQAAKRLKLSGITRQLTTAEKKKAGWYSPSSAFGPRNLDC